MSGEQSMTLKTDDINPSKRTYYNKVNFHDVSDIEGARPTATNTGLGDRRIDPLEPEYVLPSYEISVADPPPFIKNTLDVSDIWGAQPSIPKHVLISTRNHIDYSDVEGTAPKKLVGRDEGIYDPLNVTDINSDGPRKFVNSNRRTNPLTPRYEYDERRASALAKLTERGDRPEGGVMGHVSGSHPKSLKPQRQKDLMNVDDIQGAQPASFSKQIRRIVRNPNDISDIVGAQGDTKKLFSTTRHTNPLDPDYQTLELPEVESSATSVANSDTETQSVAQLVDKTNVQGTKTMTDPVLKLDLPKAVDVELSGLSLGDDKSNENVRGQDYSTGRSSFSSKTASEVTGRGHSRRKSDLSPTVISTNISTKRSTNHISRNRIGASRISTLKQQTLKQYTFSRASPTSVKTAPPKLTTSVLKSHESRLKSHESRSKSLSKEEDIESVRALPNF